MFFFLHHFHLHFFFLVAPLVWNDRIKSVTYDSFFRIKVSSFIRFFLHYNDLSLSLSHSLEHSTIRHYHLVWKIFFTLDFFSSSSSSSKQIYDNLIYKIFSFFFIGYHSWYTWYMWCGWDIEHYMNWHKHTAHTHSRQHSIPLIIIIFSNSSVNVTS